MKSSTPRRQPRGYCQIRYYLRRISDLAFTIAMASRREEDLPATGKLGQMIWGLTISQALYAAAKLEIFDILRDGAKGPVEIAKATGADHLALRRLCRALTTIDILSEDEHGKFTATAMGELLPSDHPQSMRAMALLMGSPFNWRAWGELHEAITTGKPAFDHVFGESFFEYLGRRPQDASVFNQAMTSVTSGDVPAILAAYDFSAFARLSMLVVVTERSCEASSNLVQQLPAFCVIFRPWPRRRRSEKHLWRTAAILLV
jgi:Dimerisation domain/O-methyltransferase domain